MCPVSGDKTGHRDVYWNVGACPVSRTQQDTSRVWGMCGNVRVVSVSGDMDTVGVREGNRVVADTSE